MEIKGACWSLAGAEAVLRLRSLRASGDFDEYRAFHEQQEYERNRALTCAEGQVSSLGSQYGGLSTHLSVVK